jgi:hypothetical protein
MHGVHRVLDEWTAAMRDLGERSELGSADVETITSLAGADQSCWPCNARSKPRAGEQVAACRRRRRDRSASSVGVESAARRTSIATLIAEIPEPGPLGRRSGRGRRPATRCGYATVAVAREAFDRIGTSVDEKPYRVDEIDV